MFPYIVVIILFLSRYINAPDKKKKKYKYVDLNVRYQQQVKIQINELQFRMITIRILFNFSDVIEML